MKWILPGAAVFVLDRIVKILCRDMNRVLVPGVLALRSAQNTGMALGLFLGWRLWHLVWDPRVIKDKKKP